VLGSVFTTSFHDRGSQTLPHTFIAMIWWLVALRSSHVGSLHEHHEEPKGHLVGVACSLMPAAFRSWLSWLSHNFSAMVSSVFSEWTGKVLNHRWLRLIHNKHWSEQLPCSAVL